MVISLPKKPVFNYSIKIKFSLCEKTFFLHNGKKFISCKYLNILKGTTYVVESLNIECCAMVWKIIDKYMNRKHLITKDYFVQG